MVRDAVKERFQVRNNYAVPVFSVIPTYLVVYLFLFLFRSWDSLQRVRRYHFQASHIGKDRNIGPITQTQVSMTTFGFAGMALIRPYLFGINQANQKERKAFLHFWAVLNYLIGVKDRYNIGLLNIKAAEIEFDIIMRNVMSPYLQLETLAFKRMVRDLIQGLSPYVENNDYESQMFLVKRAVGIPGYQLDVNYTREVPYGNILSKADVAMVRQTLPGFSEKIQIYTVLRRGRFNPGADKNCQKFYSEQVDPYNATTLGDFDIASPDTMKKLMGLSCTSEIRLKEVHRGPSYLKYLSALALPSLSSRSQFNVNMFLAIVSLMNLPKGVILANQIVDSRIDAMRNKKSYLDLNLNRIYPEMYMRGPGI